MAPSTLEGQVLGKYRVLEALGRGGMAQVYRGYHPQLDRYVAIKVLRSDLVEDQEFLNRFQREARAIASLRHHHIVQVFDFDTQDDIYYMVMELLEGDTLRARLNHYRTQGKRMPLPEILNIMKNVLEGLGYAHEQGIIHRDIKPANIMLTKRDEAVVTDFGIAQIVGSTQYTVSGALMGTLSYMAPEQGLHGKCDERSDLYSLGIVFYEMLTGYTPFDADTPLAILMKHLNDPLPLPRQMDPDMPQQLEQVVLKALAKDPADRYQTTQEMAAALEQISVETLPEGPRKVVPPPSGYDTRAVFSGTSRNKLNDQRFAQDDTDPDIAKSLGDEVTVEPANSGPAARKAAGLLEKPLNIPLAVLGSLGMIFLINFFASIFSAFLKINLFQYGWAFEIFLVVGFLAILMWAVQTTWLLVPSIILFGNAALVAYTALTGRWSDWAFLWLLEPLIIAAAIILPLQMRHSKLEQPFLARASGAILSLAALMAASLTCILAMVAGMLR